MNISVTTEWIFLKFQTLAQGTKPKSKMLEMRITSDGRRSPTEDDLQLKATSNGRWPQNILCWISQQPLMGSFFKFKVKLRGPNQNKKCLKWRWPSMEDDLKISKVEYLSNHWSDLPQILNLSSGDQTKIKNAWNEDDLQWKTTSKY